VLPGGESFFWQILWHKARSTWQYIIATHHHAVILFKIWMFDQKTNKKNNSLSNSFAGKVNHWQKGNWCYDQVIVFLYSWYDLWYIINWFPRLSIWMNEWMSKNSSKIFNINVHISTPLSSKWKIVIVKNWAPKKFVHLWSN